MKNLSIKTQGVKGGEPQYKENIGCTTIFINHSEDLILVDAFEGKGESYKKREQTIIEVFENGKVIFSGTKYEFFNKLKQ